MGSFPDGFVVIFLTSKKLPAAISNTREVNKKNKNVKVKSCFFIKPDG